MKTAAERNEIPVTPSPAPTLRIAVVVTHYNKGNLLRRALNSLTEQDCPDFSVVVIDDASTDPAARQCFAECRRDFASDARFRFLENDVNLGASGAINRAVGQCGGDLVMLLDADDRLPPDAVGAVTDAAGRRPDAELFFGDYRKDGDLVSCRMLCTAADELDPAKLAGNYRLLGTTPFTVKLWRDCGGFDPAIRMLNDMDFFLRAVFRPGFRGIYVGRVIYDWHFGDGGKSRRCRRREIGFMFFRHYAFYRRYLPCRRLIRQTVANLLAIGLDACGVFEFLHRYFYRPRPEGATA